MSRPLILVVEDDPDNLESIVELLREEGYDVLAASSGKEALRQAAKGAPARPSVMIVDYMLPDVLGTELVVQLHRQLGEPRVPVVFLTALAEAIDAGGAPVVRKPVTLTDLLAVLERYCAPPARPGA